MNDFLPPSAAALSSFGSILVAGTDARTYLQGQLSFDMDALTPARMELASCNSSQGRVQALLWMVERSDGLTLILPTDLVDPTLVRLRKYVLRSRVKIEAGTGRFVVGGAFAAATSPAPRAHVEQDGASLVNWPGQPSRTLVIAPAAAGLRPDSPFEAAWRLADVAAGLPQVFSATHERFVAQMLNVDLLGGISLEKGCYTGQEIIARTHFRGTVKRRMLRFRTHCAAPGPGTRIVGSDGAHAGDVVDAAPTQDGCELLAVISLGQLDQQLRLADGDSALEHMPLPYEVK